MSTRDPISLALFYELMTALSDGEFRRALCQEMISSSFPDVRSAGAEIHEKAEHAPKEYGGVMREVQNHLAPLSDEKVRESFSASDFSLEETCKQNCQVSMMFPAEVGEVYASLQRTIFSSSMIFKFRHPSAPNVVYLVDEAGQLGTFDGLRRGYSYARGMGVRMWTIWQSPSQITRNFGPSALPEFVGSSQTRQVFGIRDIETAQMISATLGMQTLGYDDPLEQISARRQRHQAAQALLAGADPFEMAVLGTQAAFAETHQKEMPRALLDPAELLTMPENQQILFVSGHGLKPIRAERYPYWTRPEMAGAYLPNPYHPPLDRVKVRTRWRSKWAKVITERVPPELAHLPQYQSGEWQYIEDYRPTY